MQFKINWNKSFIIILAAILIFTNLPLNSFAAASPWQPYSQYIPNETPTAKRELRGTWIATVVNLDWPSAKTIQIKDNDQRIQKSKDELIALLDKAVEMNMNAVFLQVSPTGDAFYKSNIVPWSRYLTGTFGKDPGFDPLAFAIEEAHKRNLELHAWFNPYRVSMDTKDSTKSSLNIKNSVYKEHPQWIKTSMDRFVVDPGIPEAREWVINRVMEVVKNYDIDGVHFDDYFYYENSEGELKDQDTYAKYNNGQFSNLGDWRRNNTYLLISGLSKKIRAAKSWVKFGISPSAVWGNKKDGHPDGSNTDSSFTNYNRSFADTKKWIDKGLLDYIAPQIYFSFGNSKVPYGEIASWWANICKGKNVHLYIGQALYKVNDDSDQYFKGTNAVQEFERQLKFNTSKPEIKGSILYRFQNINDVNKQQVVSTIKNDLWAAKALVPAMPWKDSKAPSSPSLGKIETVSNGLKISWNNTEASTAYYAVYRFNQGEKADITSDNSAKNLIATVRKKSGVSQEFIDSKVSTQNNPFYVVTSLDRLHNESTGLRISISLSANFSDIGSEYSWAYNSIDNLYEKGIVKGDDIGRFNPGQNTKRGDFLLMVVRALNLKADFKDNFTDVKNNSYYYDAIGISKALGIAKGDGNNFNPEGNITREDMMVLIVRALEASDKNLDEADEQSLIKFSDAGLISSYAREPAAVLTQAGYIQGSEGKVYPKSMATRAEIAVILDRVLNSIQ